MSADSSGSSEFGDLRSAWEESAPAVIAWFRAPGPDSYWQYHRDQFLGLLPPAGRLTLDIGCGEGRLSRDLAGLGHTVVALDGSLAIVHPIGSAGRFDGNEPDSPFVIRGSYLARFRYRDLLKRNGYSVTFESEHRPIEWYFDALESAGLLVERLRETPVPESTLTEQRQRRWQRLPLFLHIRAVRP